MSIKINIHKLNKKISILHGKKNKMPQKIFFHLSVNYLENKFFLNKNYLQNLSLCIKKSFAEFYARVAELVNALDLGSSGTFLKSSSLFSRTIKNSLTG